MEQHEFTLRNINDELHEFTGTSQWIQHWSKYLITDGIVELRDRYKCYWLVDDIMVAKLLSITEPDENLLVWKLIRVITVQEGEQVRTNKFRLSCEVWDKEIYGLDYGFSDFVGDKLMLYMANNVLYLPSEH